MTYETILTETHGRVLLIRLNRPQALNTFNRQLASELIAAAVTAEQDDGVGCLLITGAERAFAAGTDIKKRWRRSLSPA